MLLLANLAAMAKAWLEPAVTFLSIARKKFHAKFEAALLRFRGELSAIMLKYFV